MRSSFETAHEEVVIKADFCISSLYMNYETIERLRGSGFEFNSRSLALKINILVESTEGLRKKCTVQVQKRLERAIGLQRVT